MSRDATRLRPAVETGIFRRFARDRDGVTAIEFAFVALPFLCLLLAIFQYGVYFFTSEAVEAATQSAARNIYTGQMQGAGITNATDFVNQYVCPTSGGTNLSSLIDCSKLIVDIRTATTQGSFANADMNADFYQAGAATKFCLGGPADIVIVRVIYPYAVFVPTISYNTVSNVANNSGLKQLIVGTAVFQNEPFANSYVAPSGC